MSCMTSNGNRCTKCCEAIHLPKSKWISYLKGDINIVDGDLIKKIWKPISKRVAKKVNPYIFSREVSDDDRRWVMQEASYFKCTALSEDGCTIRDTDQHPEVCKLYKGGIDYSISCHEDINRSDIPVVNL